MDFKNLYKQLIPLTLLLLLTTFVFAQNTVVSGTVTDASTKKPLSFVTVLFAGSQIGLYTDDNGKYSITTDKPYDHIKISFVGYKDAPLQIFPLKTQVINVKLFPEAQQLAPVTVKAGKKPKYRNKGNPAVE